MGQSVVAQSSGQMIWCCRTVCVYNIYSFLHCQLFAQNAIKRTL